MVESEEISQEALNKARGFIFKAIEQGKKEPLRTIIQHGFPINEVIQAPGMTTLMLCASMGTEEILQVALELDPDVNQKDKIGRTALHYAARRGDLDCFNLLIENDEVDIDAQTNAGVTPLMMAVHSGNMKVIYACVNASANPFLKDGLQRTAFDYASQFPKDNLGIDVQLLITQAMDQWKEQTSEAERMATQVEFSNHFQDYIPKNL